MSLRVTAWVLAAVGICANAAAVPRLKGSVTQVTVPEPSSAGTFPRISVTLQQPDKVFQNITSRVADFGSSLEAMHKEKMVAIASQEARYEKELATQHELNTKLLSSNARIARDKATLAHRTSLLRKRASEIMGEIDVIRTEVAILKENITTVKDFVEDSLAATCCLKDAPELQVLAEFAQKDDIRAVKKRRAEGFGVILAAGENKPVSMLQIPGGFDSTGEVNEQMLQELQSNFDTLQKRMDDSSATLKGAFLHDFKNGTDEFSELLQEHEGLNSSVMSLQSIESELSNAVHFLAKKRTYMITRLRSLRLYMKVVANVTDGKHHDSATDTISTSRHTVSKSKAAAFLQIDGQAAGVAAASHQSYAQLTDPGVTSETSNLFRQLTTQVGNFDRNMRNVEQERVGSTVDKQLEYEQSLITQRKSNLKLANRNSAISYQLGHVVEDITKQRRKAMAIEEDVEKLRETMKNLRLNLSLSCDFAATTLNASYYTNASELEVLWRLDSADAAAEQKRKNSLQLQEVEHPSYLKDYDSFMAPHPKAALLALDAAPARSKHAPAQDNAVAILNDVRDELKQLHEAHVESDTDLETMYEKAFNQGNQLEMKLMADISNSNRTLARTEHLKNRVDIAVEYLQRAQTYQQVRVADAQTYLLQLSQYGDEVQLQAERG